MTDINGIQPVSGPKAIQPTESIAAGHGKIELGSISDVVEISTASMLAAKIHEIPPVRADLVARIRSEIKAGTYETEQRIEVTIDRLMDELFD